MVKLQSERYDNLYQHNIFKTTSNQSVEFVMERICTVKIEEVIFASTSKIVIIRVLCTNLHDLHLNLHYWILIRHTASSIQNQA